MRLNIQQALLLTGTRATIFRKLGKNAKITTRINNLKPGGGQHSPPIKNKTMEIIFHERSLGENFNNFPEPSTSVSANIHIADIESGEFPAIGFTFYFSEEVHSNGWWATSPKGGQCRVSIWDGDNYIG